MNESADYTVRPWVRFFAFYFDTLVIMFPVNAIWSFLDFDGYLNFVNSAYGLPPALMQVLIVLPVMALTTSRWGVTPGKWLLSTYILRDNGERMSFTSAYKRYIVAFLAGSAALVVPVCLAAYFFSYRSLTTNRRTLWDIIFHTKVIHHDIKTYKIVLFIFIIIISAMIQSIPFLIKSYDIIRQTLESQL